MIPNDRQYTNATVDQILLVKQFIATPKLHTHDLIVTGTASLANFTLLKSDTLDVTSFTATTITSTNINSINITSTDIVATSISTNSLMATDITASRAFLTDVVNQLTLGSGASITVSAPTPTSSRIYSLPDVGTDADFVMTQGAQTIGGVKTFLDTAIFISGFSILALTLAATNDQLILGTGNTITVNAPTPALSRVYTMPDVGADADFVMTEGGQLIHGVKIFFNMAVFLSGFAIASIDLASVSNQIVMGIGNTITINAPTPASSRVYAMADVGADADFVMTEGAQTIDGVKTFTATVVLLGGISLATLTLSAVTNQLILGSVKTITINAPTPVASLVYTIPDVASNASFVLTEGAETINGTKTFTTTIIDTAATNQLVLGGATTITINAPAPAVSRIYTMPDVLNHANFILSEGVQTLNGTKTFTVAIIDTAVTNQLILGSGNTITVNAPTPIASRIYTIPDVLLNADFIFSEGTQTINGAKTFSTQIKDLAVINQLVLGSGTTITVNAPTPAANRIYTMPDVGGNANFVMTMGTQTIGGAKTFSLAITDTAVTNQLVLGVGTTITVNAPSPASSHVYTMPDVLLSADFVMTEGAQIINGVKTFTSSPVFPALTLTNIVLTDTTNQILLGTGQTITVNAPTPGASHVYTMPDVLLNADFVMSEGIQTINGSKTFSVAIRDTATTNQLILGTGTTITVNAPAPAANRIYTMTDVLANASFVMTAGLQTIGGAKTFSLAITDSAVTNQLILGTGTTITVNAPAPAASRIYTMPDVLLDAKFVMTEGAQIINGVKTFTSAPVFPALTLTNITLTDVTNQILLGTGNTIQLTAPTPAANRIYTMPDVLTSADFVMNQGSQTINGAKTFTSAIIDSATTNQLILGSVTTITIHAPTPAANRIYTMTDVLANASFVMTQGAQTIAGSKTFSSAITDTATTNQLILGNVTTITLHAPAPAVSHTYTMPDVLLNADFVMTEGIQTLNGAKTFSSTITDTATTNQIILGSVTTITLNAPTPAANRVYTISDVLANANFIMSEGVQTVNGAKTFSTQIKDTATTNQLVLGNVTTITVNAPAPAANRIYTMPDVLSNASFVMTEAAQTINGLKTFSLALTDGALTNQLVLGAVTTITINAPAPAVSHIYTMPDVLLNADFVMTEGNQTINGVKTFTSSPVFPALSFASLTLTNTSNQLTLGTGQTITFNSPTPAASRTYTTPDVGTNANFVLTEGAQSINGVKTFSSAFTNTLTSNQLILGTTQTITLTAPTPAASRTYTIPDVLGAAFFVMTAGTQTIGGAKTFSSSVTINPVTNQLVLGVTNTITINGVAPAASRIYTTPDVGADASFVMTQGAQTIAGNKSFTGQTGFSDVVTLTGTASILLPTSGGTPSNLSFYQVLNTTIGFTSGAFAGTQTVNVHFSRVGNSINVIVEGFTVTGNNVAGSMTGTAIAAIFRPFVTFTILIDVTNNNVKVPGVFSVSSATGVPTIFASTVGGANCTLGGNFTATNSNIGFTTFCAGWVSS